MRDIAISLPRYHDMRSAFTVSSNVMLNCVFVFQLINEDDFAIAPNDPKSCNKQGVFYIAIYGYHATSYTVTVMHYGGVVTLHAGNAQTGEVFRGLGQYYQFRMGPEAMDLVITLTTQSGDADI